MMKNQRYHAILARWIDVIGYGAIAGLVWYTCAPAIESLSAPLVELIASMPLWPRLIFWGFTGCVFLWFVGRHRWMGLLGLRHFHLFPPLWLSILFAAITAALLNTIWSRDPLLRIFMVDLVHATSRLAANYSLALGGVVIALFAYPIIKRWYDSLASEPPSDSSAGGHPQSDWKVQLKEFETLKRWVNTDSEVTQPDQDLFGHDSIAQRIARRLEDSPPEAMPTIAVVGEQGSGKSTIGSLVAHHLHSSPSMLFVKLSLWPFDSTDAAVRGILNEVVRVLGTRVNTLSLTGLPEKYAATVENLRPWTSVLALFRQSPTPTEIIEQVDRIALATGLRIVLWIEDLERFSGTATLEAESAALRDEERLGPIRSLLWLLNECKRIGVIVADTSLRSRFDVEKIARFVERIPPLDLDQAGEVIGFFRQKCLNGYPKEVVDPVHHDEREKFKPSNPLVRSIGFYYSREQEPDAFEALIDVVRTPRSLKNVLRWTIETWEQLPGEIDLDHVIAASALRSNYPEVFEFIDNNIHWFRRGFRTFGSKDNNPMEHEAYLAFEKLLGRPKYQAVSSAIKSLVRFVFSAFPEPQVIADIDRQYLTRPQGLNIAEPVDYWNRYLTCAPVANDRSDQFVLRQIQAWTENKDNELVSYLMDENLHSQVEAFLNKFNYTDLLRLLDEVVDQERREGVANWSYFESPLGGVSVWGMLNRCLDGDSRMMASKLEKLMQDLIPSHLPYARFLLHYFCVPEGSTVFPLTDKDDTKSLAELGGNLLLESFSPGNAGALRDALQGANPYLLRNLLQDIRSGRGITGDLPIVGWEPFAETLLELAELDATIGIPTILTFVTSASDRIVEQREEGAGARGHRTRVTECRFQEETAKALFDWNRLRPLLKKAKIPDDIDEWSREMWRVASDAVRA